MKTYIVPRDELIELLAARHRLAVLEGDGVDNWQWYMYGRQDYFAENYSGPKHLDGYDIDFEDLAVQDLSDYSSIED